MRRANLFNKRRTHLDGLIDDIQGVDDDLPGGRREAANEPYSPILIVLTLIATSHRHCRVGDARRASHLDSRRRRFR